MSYLKLAWIPRTTPAQDTNHAVNPRMDYAINNLVTQAEKMLALGEVNEFFDEAERDEHIPTKYSGYNYISYQVPSGDDAVEILTWWSKRGYKVSSFRDDQQVGSRDYAMYKRGENEHTGTRFSIYMYFNGDDDECRFEDVVDESGVKVVNYTVDAVEEHVVYKRKLVCGGSDIPDSVEDEG
jgi:hypothetical protein